MDITCPMSGIEGPASQGQPPAVAVVALTIHEDEQYFFEMPRRGLRAVPSALLQMI
jgi:hypothetical protein